MEYLTLPNHYTQPVETPPVFFNEAYRANFYNCLKHLKDTPAVGMEIGVLHGAASCWLMENILNHADSKLYCMDMNEDDYWKKNIEPYKSKISLVLGYSCDTIRKATHENKTKDFLDFVYVDGSHIAMDVMEDCVNSYYLLKDGGIMILDDYGWGDTPTNSDERLKTKNGIDGFLTGYQGNYDMLGIDGWQIYIRKAKNSIVKEYQK